MIYELDIVSFVCNKTNMTDLFVLEINQIIELTCKSVVCGQIRECCVTEFVGFLNFSVGNWIMPESNLKI
jgi:hypothetical protein